MSARALAERRVRAAGLEDRITLLLSDYRDLEGDYDKLVSVEMIEAVGHRHYPKFFETCGKLLKDDGRMLMQAITIADQRRPPTGVDRRALARLRLAASAEETVRFAEEQSLDGGGLARAGGSDTRSFSLA
ncbi:MAG: hypothetical protein GY711_22560 [bacterium]|nr:hypothetical protein [bacterium]